MDDVITSSSSIMGMSGGVKTSSRAGPRDGALPQAPETGMYICNME